MKLNFPVFMMVQNQGCLVGIEGLARHFQDNRDNLVDFQGGINGFPDFMEDRKLKNRALQFLIQLPQVRELETAHLWFGHEHFAHALQGVVHSFTQAVDFKGFHDKFRGRFFDGRDRLLKCCCPPS